jgi:allantoin racemase
MQPRLLILNPNTSASVTRTLRGIALKLAHGPEVRTRTARLGAAYISDEVSFAIAGHALLDAYAADCAEHGDAPPTAVLIACFGDPGLEALRQLCPVPVLGLAQASMQVAHLQGQFAVMTGGAPWVPMLARLVSQLGFADRCIAIEAVEKTGAQLAADPQAAVQELSELCLSLLRDQPGLKTLLLGGAALGGMATEVEQRLRAQGAQLRILDSVAVALKAAFDAASAHAKTPQNTQTNLVHGGPVNSVAAPIPCANLSAELTHLLNGAPR